ncbi:MAG: photosystem reaction center protein [Clostridia bacterium]|nr:photosystem reaction center protein [Clostridia bacterium]
MVKTSELKQKEVININDGKRLGLVSDMEINMETGNLEAIVIPAGGKLLGFFSKENDIVIRWSSIKKIGIDVILVDGSIY